MKTSESLSNISEALAKAQAEIPAMKKTATNPFLRNKYIPLDDMLTTSTPILAKHGITIVQLPFSEGDRIGLSTRVIHKSGEWFESEISLEASEEKGKSGAQVAGSIITYLRRYSYSSVLGIASETDDDGHGKPERIVEELTAASRSGKNGKPQANTKAPPKWKPDAIKWMVDEGYAEDDKDAATIWDLLQLNEVSTKQEVSSRVNIYWEARQRKFTKDVAAEHAINGNSPEGEPA